jgi:hypothetical protein
MASSYEQEVFIVSSFQLEQRLYRLTQIIFVLSAYETMVKVNGTRNMLLITVLEGKCKHRTFQNLMIVCFIHNDSVCQITVIFQIM